MISLLKHFHDQMICRSWSLDQFQTQIILSTGKQKTYEKKKKLTWLIAFSYPYTIHINYQMNEFHSLYFDNDTDFVPFRHQWYPSMIQMKVYIFDPKVKVQNTLRLYE